MAHEEELEQLFEDVKAIASIKKIESPMRFDCLNDWIIETEHLSDANHKVSPVKVSLTEKRIVITIENYSKLETYEAKLFFIIWGFFRYYENAHRILYNTDSAKNIGADTNALNFLKQKEIINDQSNIRNIYNDIKNVFVHVGNNSYHQIVRTKRVFQWFATSGEYVSFFKLIIGIIKNIFK